MSAATGKKTQTAVSFVIYVRAIAVFQTASADFVLSGRMSVAK
jgi:hypothetical protein